MAAERRISFLREGYPSFCRKRQKIPGNDIWAIAGVLHSLLVRLAIDPVVLLAEHNHSIDQIFLFLLVQIIHIKYLQIIVVGCY